MSRNLLNLTPRLLEVIQHIGHNGASSEAFLMEKFSLSKSTLYELKRSGYLKCEMLDVRREKGNENIFYLQNKSKSILGKGNYMKGKPKRNELPTLLYMQEVVEMFRQRYKYLVYMTERQIKSKKVRDQGTFGKPPLIKKIEGLNDEEAKAQAQFLQAESPDGRLHYGLDENSPKSFINIEIDSGNYHGKELANKLLQFEEEQYKTIWICTKRSSVKNVQKYAELLNIQNVAVTYIEDLFL